MNTAHSTTMSRMFQHISEQPLCAHFLRRAFSVLMAALSVAFVAYGEDTEDLNILIATALGVGFTVLLGTGLMVLTFLSSRSGHDDEAGRKRTDKE